MKQLRKLLLIITLLSCIMLSLNAIETKAIIGSSCVGKSDATCVYSRASRSFICIRAAESQCR